MLDPSVLTGGAVAVVLGLAACSSGGGQSEGVRSTGPAQRGGTLHVLDEGTVLSWDPQRVYSSSDMSVANRLFSRTLTTFAPGTTRDQQRTLVPDLARDTGTTGDGGRTWSFVLRAGAAWQDGRPVTCADVKYGISRQFAVDRLQGGPQYGLRYLDIPRNPNGSSRYAGPYRRTGQALFDKAVSCRGNTLGVRLNQPLPDFNRMVSLPAFSPFRADHDQGSGSNLEVFSNGPYMLKGAWKSGTGGVFVRNPHWDAAQDPIRKAYPDQVAFTEGLDTQQVVQRLVADRGDDAAAVTRTSVPPAAVESALAAPGARSRSTNPLSPLVEYLAPNLKSPSMANFKARQALAMSTDRTAYVQAMGGTRTAVPTTAVISQTLDAYRAFDPFGVGLSGDPKRAKVLLQQSGSHLAGSPAGRLPQGHPARPGDGGPEGPLGAGRLRRHVDPAGQPLHDHGQPGRLCQPGRRLLGAVGGRLRVRADDDPAAVRQPGQPLRGRLGPGPGLRQQPGAERPHGRGVQAAGRHRTGTGVGRPR